jgi:hypothetical protein
VHQTLLDESRTVLERAEQLRERLSEAFFTRTAEELERSGVGDEDAAQRLARMAGRTIDALLRTDPPAGPIHALDAAPLGHDLPWTIRGGDARALGALAPLGGEEDREEDGPASCGADRGTRTHARQEVRLDGAA